ncbi:hypothetical protein HK099_001263 [Clydaea vesicula]|uniref:L domain-like protein n=1 Tax=Clydaea vesicula TaxID=447962 RepID=A0AAD5U843_9FUNG|nr:hypothetical protein HK099_001263 [Clydaea vesicula]KAJ3387222.1 hypothetical protein HDU92_002048 [Lobulomyces angularis]
MKFSKILIAVGSILSSINASKPPIDPEKYLQSNDCLTVWAWLPQIYPNGIHDCCEITADNKESMPLIITCDINKRVTAINIGIEYNPASTLVKGNWKSNGFGILNAPLPAYLGNLTELTTLYVTGAALYGQIPIELSKLTKLQHFSLSNNALTGEVPAGLFTDMENLISLDISNNKLTGPIPDSFVNLPNLISLQLDSNQFSGPLPDLSYLVGIGEGPKYDIANGGFDPVCRLNNLGPKACVNSLDDLKKVPTTCTLPVPELKVCVAETIKTKPTPVYQQAEKRGDGLNDTGKVVVGVLGGIVFLAGAYLITFTLIRKGNAKDAALHEMTKKERLDRASD